MGKILKGYGHRISAVSITMLMLGMMFIGLMSFSEDVAAQSPLYADATRTGYIDRDGPTYPPAGPGSVITGTLLSVGQDKSANYYSYRTFLSFDTSYIPDNAVIQEVMLYMRLYNDYSAVDFSAQVYQSEYGTLDTGDWDDYHTYQGDLLYTTAASNGRWYSMNLMGSSISTTGYSEYLIKSSLDRYVCARIISTDNILRCRVGICSISIDFLCRLRYDLLDASDDLRYLLQRYFVRVYRGLELDI